MARLRSFRFVFHFAWALAVQLGMGCKSTPNEPDGEIEDFGFASATSVEDEAAKQSYYQAMEHSSAAISFVNSFPLAISVAEKVDNFPSTPPQAFAPVASRLTLQLGERCLAFIKTGSVSVHRYLFAGDWIKMGAELPQASTLKLDSEMDINLQMSTPLSISIPQRMYRNCWKLLYGRKTFIGYYSLEKSKASLIPSPQSQPLALQRVSKSDATKSVHIHWIKGQRRPVLRDENDFPIVVQSPIYRTKLQEKGFYYLHFQPVLRLKNVDRLVVKIPVREIRKNMQRKPKSQPRQKKAH